MAGVAVLRAVCGASVVPAGRYPGTGAVALIARKSRRHVSSMFAWCGSSIVASGALSRYGRTVVVARAKPGGSIKVAAFTRRIGNDVCVGFRGGYDTLADCMATVAIPRGSLEHPTRMAGFACCRGMPAGKRETGGHMVEVAAPQLGFGHSLQ